jgi:methylglutamate dehydrogenase subunit D
VIREVTGLALPDGAGGGIVADGRSAFGIAPGRFLVVDPQEGTAAALKVAVPPSVGTITDLSHGRTAIRMSGPKSEWVLAKFFAIDFSLPAFPEWAGRATAHHDIFAQLQRTGPEQFDVYVFRSFARSFWTALCHASEEVGYEVR